MCTQRQKEKEIYLLSSSNLSEDKKAALETETAEIKVSPLNFSPEDKKAALESETAEITGSQLILVVGLPGFNCVNINLYRYLGNWTFRCVVKMILTYQLNVGKKWLRLRTILRQ